MMGQRILYPISHHSRLRLLRICAIALLALLTVSCARLPPLKTVDGSTGRNRHTQCSAVFPAERWRLVHSVETVISGNPTGVVIGITIIAPAKREVEAIIMTLEGLVLFHARSSDHTTDVLRAIAPFDSPHFAGGLIEDVRLLFLAPVAVKTLTGFSSSGNFTCRYVRGDTSTVDILPGPEGSWKLREYDRRANLLRKVTATADGNCTLKPDHHLPCHIDLQATQQPAYMLRMSLLQAERVTESIR